MSTSEFILTETHKEFLEKASTWLSDIVKKRKEKESSRDDKEAECVVGIPDHDYNQLIKYLKRTKSWKIHYDGDKEDTLFKMVDGQLRAYDSRYPQGRRVYKTSEHLSAFKSADFVPTSTRGLIDHIVCTFNGPDGWCDENINVSRYIYSHLPDGKVNVQILFWTAFFMMANQHNVVILPSPMKDSFVLGVPNDINETDGLLLRQLFIECLRLTHDAEIAVDRASASA